MNYEFKSFKFITQNSSFLTFNLSVFPMAFDPDPAPFSWFPTATFLLMGIPPYLLIFYKIFDSDARKKFNTLLLPPSIQRWNQSGDLIFSKISNNRIFKRTKGDELCPRNWNVPSAMRISLSKETRSQGTWSYVPIAGSPSN
jgi:hypothetical protein